MKIEILTKMAGKVFPGDMLLGGHAVSMRESFVMGREWLCRSPQPFGLVAFERGHCAGTR
jgi:hypothetical protein